MFVWKRYWFGKIIATLERVGALEKHTSYDEKVIYGRRMRIV